MKIKIFIFSILFIFLCLFLALNQECFATSDTDIIFTNSDCNIEWNLTEIFEQYNISDFTLNTDKQFILWNYVQNYWYVLFISDTFYLDDDNYLCSDNYVIIRANPLSSQQYIDICSHNIENGSVLLNTDIIDLDIRYNVLYPSENVVIYDDDTLTTYLDLSQLNGVIEGDSDITNLIESGSGSGSDSESDNIFELISNFFSNFWDNIIHIIIPSQEDFEDLQESFENNVLSAFTITALSRSSDYSNNDKYDSINYNNKLPIINIMGFDYDTSGIYNLLHTPITFGRLQYNMGDTISTTQVYTGGLTAYNIINLIIAIEFAFLNISLYNKFFNKGE